MDTLEPYRGEIFELYIGRKMSSKEVTCYLEQTYSLKVTYVLYKISEEYSRCVADYNKSESAEAEAT